MELGLYQHCEGRFYDVVDVAKHSDTLEEMVVYCAMYGNFDTWVRPRSSFEELVSVNGQKVPRFRLIEAIEGDSDLGLLCVSNSEDEVKDLVNLLEEAEIKVVVRRDKFKPKPAHLENDLFLKIFIDEEDFELALDLIQETHEE